MTPRLLFRAGAGLLLAGSLLVCAGCGANGWASTRDEFLLVARAAYHEATRDDIIPVERLGSNTALFDAIAEFEVRPTVARVPAGPPTATDGAWAGKKPYQLFFDQ